jgi:hypothetical protein
VDKAVLHHEDCDKFQLTLEKINSPELEDWLGSFLIFSCAVFRLALLGLSPFSATHTPALQASTSTRHGVCGFEKLCGTVVMESAAVPIATQPGSALAPQPNTTSTINSHGYEEAPTASSDLVWRAEIVKQLFGEVGEVITGGIPSPFAKPCLHLFYIVITRCRLYLRS